MAAYGYTVNNLFAGSQQNISTAITSATGTVVRLNVPASTGKRFYLWELDFGQSGPPNATDCSVQWTVQQCSAVGAGIGSAATPLPTQGTLTTDVAVTVATVNYTAAPTTYSATQTWYAKGINQRGAGFWQAAPGGEVYLPITASTGPGMTAYSATYASTVIGRINFSEI